MNNEYKKKISEIGIRDKEKKEIVMERNKMEIIEEEEQKEEKRGKREEINK